MATKKKVDTKKTATKKENVKATKEVEDNAVDQVTEEVIETEDQALVVATPNPMEELAAMAALPDLDQAQEIPLDLMSEYWTPEDKGESKKLFFKEVAMSHSIDTETGEQTDLPCVFFFDKQKDGTFKTIRNGSTKLVGVFEGANVQRLAPFKITYLGKVDNKTNAFKSDNWSVNPLFIKA